MMFRKIPLSVQLEAAFAAVSVHNRNKVGKILRGYGYPFWIWNHEKHLKKRLTFTPRQLFEYLEQNPQICESMIADCKDKRYSPSTFIELKNNKYTVGYIDTKSVPSYQDVLYFDTAEEAVTDYILFSLSMSRFNKYTVK